MVFPKSSSTSFFKFGINNSIQANRNHVNEKHPGRIVMVSNWLPLKGHRDVVTRKWWFEHHGDDDLFSQLGFSEDTRELVYYVGLLDVDIDTKEQDEVSALLEDKFHCIPVFRSWNGSKELYHCFCNNYLWPLFHGMLVDTTKFEFDLAWEAYKFMNIAFVGNIMHAIHDVDEDYVWIHDYNLMVLPSFLRKKITNLKLGFFLHVPFPSRETYQTMPVLKKILRGLLSCDLVGFPMHDYASQFFVCCRRLFGLNNELRCGDTVIEFNGRIISTVIQPVGICTDQIESVKSLTDTAKKVKELKEKFDGKFVVVAVDDVDVLKGNSSNFLAMGELLKDHPELRGKVVLVQILKPARGLGIDVQAELEGEICQVCTEINLKYGGLDYEPIVCISGPVSIQDKVAYYAISGCCLVNSMRDGMNLGPYKYTVSRQADKAESVVIVSEFVGCSRSLSGAIRVNPWNIDSVSSALFEAITMPADEKQMHNEKRYKYVTSREITCWGRKFLDVLEKACEKNNRKRCWKVGFGLGSSTVLAFGPKFESLWDVDVVSAYEKSNNRLILLDCDGTLMPHGDAAKGEGPSNEVLSLLNGLCSDPKNVVFIVSGRGKEILSDLFSPCKSLGLSAEHGYFTRWNGNCPWEKLPDMDFRWKEMALDRMTLLHEQTAGSYIERKESGLVWHHKYGTLCANELLDDLTSLLAEEPVVVKKGLNIIEADAQGLGKGMVAKSLAATMKVRGKQPDFVLCIGNGQSDEEMFAAADDDKQPLSMAATAQVFTCTVGIHPSRANYYLEDTNDVIRMLKALEAASSQDISERAAAAN